MKRKSILFFIMFLMAINALNAQLFDSIAYSLKFKPKIYANFGTRNSFVTNTHSKVRELLVGLNYNKTTRFAVGYAWLDDNIKRIRQDEENNPLETTLKLNYVGFLVDYSFYKTSKIEVNIPVHIGAGVLYYQYGSRSESIQFDKTFTVFYEPAMEVTYRFLRYFGVGGGMGYRLMLTGNNQINENFNAPTYTIKAKIFFGDLYNDLFKR